jgi:hypothetical protein
MSLNRDFSELLSELNTGGARYLLVGGYALSLYGRPRATGDLDLWIDSTPQNAACSRQLFVISELDFVRNKRSVGRAQDLVDAEEIQAILDDRGGLE